MVLKARFIPRVMPCQRDQGDRERDGNNAVRRRRCRGLGRGSLVAIPQLVVTWPFEKHDRPGMLGADDLGGVAVERGQLPPLVAPGLVQEVVADHAGSPGEGRRRFVPPSSRYRVRTPWVLA